MSERLTDEVIERARLAREEVEQARRRDITQYKLYRLTSYVPDKITNGSHFASGARKRVGSV